MDDNNNKLTVEESPTGILHNISFYLFIGIMGISFLSIMGYMIYAIFAF